MAQAVSIGQVQSELAARIGLIGARAANRRAGDLAIEIDAIRQIARGERGALIQGWLSILGDAVGCDRQDRAACETFVAACSVRLSS
jgi:hypothetical protein